jgi:hypothetical protein
MMPQSSKNLDLESVVRMSDLSSSLAVQFYTDTFRPRAHGFNDSSRHRLATAFQVGLFQSRVLNTVFLDIAMSRSRAMPTRRLPGAITTKMICILCGGNLRLTAIEPSYDGKRLDNHIFACSKCDEIRRMCSTAPKRFAIAPVARRITLAGADLRGSA